MVLQTGTLCDYSMYRTVWPELFVLCHTAVLLLHYGTSIITLVANHRITYKIAMLTFKTKLHHQPIYLSAMLHNSSVAVVKCWLVKETNYIYQDK